ncbi:MAG: DNA recombination protein RmuC [Micrococcales bacterium]
MGAILARMDITSLLVAFVALAIGVVIGILWSHYRLSGKTDGSTTLELEKKLAASEATVAGLNVQITEAARERSERDARDKAAVEEQNKILQQLAPLQQRLNDVDTKVGTMEKERGEQFTELLGQLNEARLIQTRLDQNTFALQSALSNNQTRGKWGELTLRKLLESSGLVSGVHFVEQLNTKNADGQIIKPDFTINFPDAKFVAIDVKFPYSNYDRAMAVPEVASADDEKNRKNFMAAHVQDVRNHIKAISDKSYYSGLEASPEFTVLFVPNEGILAATLAADTSIMEDAMKLQVALVSPVSLFGLLRTIQYGWRQAAQEETMKEVINLGVTLHKYVRTVAEHAGKLGGYLNSAVASYNSFVSSLERNLLTATRRLNEKSMGILDQGKSVPEIKELTDGTDIFTKPELTVDPLPLGEEDNKDR